MHYTCCCCCLSSPSPLPCDLSATWSVSFQHVGAPPHSSPPPPHTHTHLFSAPIHVHIMRVPQYQCRQRRTPLLFIPARSCASVLNPIIPTCTVLPSHPLLSSVVHSTFLHRAMPSSMLLHLCAPAVGISKLQTGNHGAHPNPSYPTTLPVPSPLGTR
jgi:hypothetical protein